MCAAIIWMLALQAAQTAFPFACSWEQPCRDTACQCVAQRSARAACSRGSGRALPLPQAQWKRLSFLCSPCLNYIFVPARGPAGRNIRMLCFNTRFTFLWRCSLIGKMEVIFFFSSDFFITMLSSWWLKNSSWGCVICASVSPLVLLLLGKCLGTGQRDKVFFLRITPYFKGGKYCAVKYHLDEHLQKNFHQRPLAENAFGQGIGHILSFFSFFLLKG